MTRYNDTLKCLWDKKMQSCQKKILPTFNTMVIFSTTDFSNHGHPEPLNCPNHITRKSIATYYFSEKRPINEISYENVKNRTYFKTRSGFKDDVAFKNENLKNIFRRLKFYNFLKKIEKKYFRTGNSAKRRLKDNK